MSGLVQKTYIDVGVVYQYAEGGQDLLDGLDGRGRVLVAAQVDDDPGDVSEEGDGDVGVDEGEQGLHHAHPDDQVSTLGAVTCGQ